MLALVWLKKEHWMLQNRILKAIFSLINDTAATSDDDVSSGLDFDSVSALLLIV